MTTCTLSQQPNHVQRRGLLAGAGLLALAGGATIAPGPDAYLVSLCARYIEADMRHEVLCGQQDAMDQSISSANNAKWSRLDDLVLDEGAVMLELEPQIAALPATSPAGIRAKAHAVSRMSRLYKDDNGAELLRSLLSDLLPAGRA